MQAPFTLPVPLRPSHRQAADGRLVQLQECLTCHADELQRLRAERLLIPEADTLSRAWNEHLQSTASDNFWRCANAIANVGSMSTIGRRVKADTILAIHIRPVYASDSSDHSRCQTLELLATSLAADIAVPVRPVVIL
jgi:hypothetical protein